MGDHCTVCEKDVGDKFAICDSCHCIQHPVEACTGLSSSELRAVIIQKRTQECRTSFKNIPTLLREIKSFKTEFTSLKKEVDELKNEMKTWKDENKNLKSEMTMLKEVIKNTNENTVTISTKRDSGSSGATKWENNVIVANVRESQDAKQTKKLFRFEEIKKEKYHTTKRRGCKHNKKTFQKLWNNPG
ncbi:hypothetical protein JTB14_009507 [Gonioctena quinquepunctata]|nr:hypothetical protein JTB14_009507 [Gonioctena quinquepunctata]